MSSQEAHLATVFKIQKRAEDPKPYTSKYHSPKKCTFKASSLIGTEILGKGDRHNQQGFGAQNGTAIFHILTWTLKHSPGLQLCCNQPTFYSPFRERKVVPTLVSTMVYNRFITQIQVIWVLVTVTQGWHTAGFGTIGQGCWLTIPGALQLSNRIA